MWYTFHSMETITYLNGRFLPATEAMLPLSDLAIVRGYGVFDYCRTYQRRPFHIEHHVARLGRSAAQLHLHLPHTPAEIIALVDELIERNPHLPEMGLRFVVTGGVAADLFTPTGPPSLAIMPSPAPSYPPHLFTDGARLITTPLGREFPTIKSLNYIGAILAMRGAAEQGAIEALYVDEQGRGLECTRCNFVGVQGGRLLTPLAGVLDGITRAAVLALAQPELTVMDTAVPLADLDEAFITSSTKGVMPITHIDGRPVGHGRPGPLTQALHEQFWAYAWGPSVS